MKASADSGLDPTSIKVFTKNGSSRRLRRRKGVIVALTLEGFYYAGRVVVDRVVNRDPYLVRIHVLDVPDNLDMPIPFPEGDLVFLRQCPGRSIVWEANNIYPYAESEGSTNASVGWQPIQVNVDEKPIQQFLSFTVNMHYKKTMCYMTAIYDCKPVIPDKNDWKTTRGLQVIVDQSRLMTAPFVLAPSNVYLDEDWMTGFESLTSILLRGRAADQLH